MSRKCFYVAFTFLASLVSLPALANDWRNDVNWSIGNETGPDRLDCPDQYVATEARCSAEGGRACLMKRAIESAKAKNCSYAMRLTLVTQCHNSGAQQRLGGAGEKTVCEYLATK